MLNPTDLGSLFMGFSLTFLSLFIFYSVRKCLKKEKADCSKKTFLIPFLIIFSFAFIADSLESFFYGSILSFVIFLCLSVFIYYSDIED